MKAKLYVFHDRLEFKLEDGSEYVPKKKENKEEFIERIKGIVENEYLDDFELVEIDHIAVSTNEDSVLLEALETADGLQKKLIEAVLDERGLLQKPAKAEKEPKEKIGKRDKDEMMSSKEYKDVEANINKVIEFSPSNSTEVFEGKVVGVALNKTNTRIYYTVLLENGKRKCCSVLNETIKLKSVINEPKKEAATKKPTAKKAAAKGDAGDDLV